MYDSYLEIPEGDELQKRLIERGATEIVDEFERIVYSFTDEEFAEMRAALEEYPLETFDKPDDTK